MAATNTDQNMATKRQFESTSKPTEIDQTAQLLKLEEKFGNRKFRIESAHQSVSGPKTRAEKFRNYTEWLSKAKKRKPVTVANANLQANVTGDSNLQFASPDILVGPLTNEVQAKSAGLAMPVDESKLSIERLERIDIPVARVITTPEKPNFMKAKKAIRVTTKARTIDVPQPPEAPFSEPEAPEVPVIDTSKSQESSDDSMANVVAWEVDDFQWPKALDTASFANTDASAAMLNSIVNSFSVGEKRLVVAGSGRGPGTTTIATYAARVLAANQKSVLLVDADLTKPDLTEVLGLPSSLSWTNILTTQRLCNESVIRSKATGICMMPLFKMIDRVAYPDFILDCLGGILDAVQMNFEYVIVDVGPASQLMRELRHPNILADAVMLVHNVRTPDRAIYARNQSDLSNFGVKKLVIAENFTVKKSA